MAPDDRLVQSLPPPAVRAGASGAPFDASRKADIIAVMDVLGRLIGSARRLVMPAVFVVDVRDGAAKIRRGQVTPGFLSGLSDVARDVGIVSGTIYGEQTRDGIALRFSADIPAESHQRLRNVLAMHRQQARLR